MGRPTRRRRRLVRKRPKGKARGKGRAFLCRLCSSHYDALEAEEFGTFIAKRMKGRGKGKQRKNPIGPDGQIMKCHICGSDTHLKSRCDQNPDRKSQKSQGRTHYVQPPEASQDHEIREVLDNGEEVELSECEIQTRAQTEEFHTLDYCFFTDSASDYTIVEHRPRCQCQCETGGCPHRP